MLAIYMRKFSMLKMRKFNKRGITIKKETAIRVEHVLAGLFFISFLP